MKYAYIVCVDSDGCAMDTMNVKHMEFFGPLAAKVFGIERKTEFLNEWNRINLYSSTRGINRFKGLVMGLQYAKAHGEHIGEIEALVEWVQHAPVLSNAALAAAIEVNPDEALKKALDWSYQVNHGIETQLAGNDRPFDGVATALATIHQHANVAIVSSANSEAIHSEWERHHLMPSVDEVYGQERGSKAAALAQIIESGYAVDHVLMVGDAPGDLAAARENGTYFYPILFDKEQESWQQLVDLVVPRFIAGELSAKDNHQFMKQFEAHLAQYEV